jgi:hypothetical protein
MPCYQASAGPGTRLRWDGGKANAQV